MKNPNLLLWRMLFVAVLATVLWLALGRAPSGMPSLGWDKANHALAFAVLMLLGLRAFPGRWLAVAIGLGVYGALIEVLQARTVTRHGEWADLLADVAGILIALAVHALAGRGRWFRR